MTSPVGEYQTLTLRQLRDIRAEDFTLQWQADGNTTTYVNPPGSSTVFTWNLHEETPPLPEPTHPGCPVIRARLERRELEEEYGMELNEPDSVIPQPRRRSPSLQLLRNRSARRR